MTVGVGVRMISHKNETMLLICVFDSGRSPGYAYRVGRCRRTKPPAGVLVILNALSNRLYVPVQPFAPT